MSELLNLDRIIRVLYSFLYRIILLLLAIIVLNARTFLYFPVEYYWFSIALYLIIIIPLRFTSLNKYDTLRLIVDQTFIIFVLYGNFDSTLPEAIFLLIPLINSPNFSGRKKSYILLIILQLFTISICYKRNPNFSEVFAICITTLIKYFESIRIDVQNYIHTFHEEMSEIYLSSSYFNKATIVYSEFLKKINTSKLIEIGQVKGIYRIIFSTRKLTSTIIGGSQFGSKMIINDPGEFAKSVTAEKIFSNWKINIDNDDLSGNIIIPIKKNNDSYNIYILKFEPTKHIVNFSNLIRDNVLLKPCLVPAFNQFEKHLQVEQAIRQEKKSQLRGIKGGYRYVLRTISAVHFVRNKLSPIKNYLDIAEDTKTFGPISDDQADTLAHIMSAERVKAISSLKEILTRTSHVLNNKQNPYNVSSDIKTQKIDFIYKFTHRITNDYYLKVAIKEEAAAETPNLLVNVSLRGLELLLSDIVNNMYKYNDGTCSITYNITETHLVAAFQNNFKEGIMSDVIKAKNYINSEENTNIFKMESKGLYLMKDICKQMSINLNCTVNTKDRTFIILLEFPLCAF